MAFVGRILGRMEMKVWNVLVRGVAIGMWLMLGGCQLATEEDPADQGESAAFELPYYDEATFTAKWMKAEEVPADFHALGSFALKNQLGEVITEDSLKGKVNICSFFFTTCPGICPRLMENLKTIVADSLADSGVQMLSFTAQPSVDSVSRMRAYGEDHGIDARNWYLITGDRSALYRLGRHELFIEEDLGLESKDDEFLHTENVVLLDENNRIRGIYNGLNKASLAYLLKDVEVLLR